MRPEEESLGGGGNGGSGGGQNSGIATRRDVDGIAVELLVLTHDLRLAEALASVRGRQSAGLLPAGVVGEELDGCVSHRLDVADGGKETGLAGPHDLGESSHIG